MLLDGEKRITRTADQDVDIRQQPRRCADHQCARAKPFATDGPGDGSPREGVSERVHARSLRDRELHATLDFMRFWIALASLFLATVSFAQSDPEARSWNEPVEPFRIVGNLYYVGASDITSYLFATPEGHIVIDGGFEETAPQIRANIEKLGFKLRDVRILLNSHGHFDHAAGLAELKSATGARFLASAREIPLLARGGLDDPQFGNRFPFPRIYADGIVRDGQRVTVGGTSLVAHLTPGHTPGCTSWTTEIRDRGRTHRVILMCSSSVPESYRLIDNPRHPDAVADYRSHFAFLRSQRPDIPLGSHGRFFDLKGKIEKMRAGASINPFIDPEGYAQHIAASEKRFEEAVAKQSAR
jgi:metallo-beta-lactamase class B